MRSRIKQFKIEIDYSLPLPPSLVPLSVIAQYSTLDYSDLYFIARIVPNIPRQKLLLGKVFCLFGEIYRSQSDFRAAKVYAVRSLRVRLEVFIHSIEGMQMRSD